MKHLNQFITEYIIKKKLDKPIDSEDHYEYFPKTTEELVENIEELINNEIYDLNCIDTSEITDMSYLFKDLGDKIENNDFDVSEWNVSNVENMEYMFCLCQNFTGKGLENWDVSNVENISYMFSNCYKFNCNLSSWNVINVENMFFAFYDCTSLKNKPSWYNENT